MSNVATTAGCIGVTTSPWSTGKPVLDQGEVCKMSQIAAGDSFASLGPGWVVPRLTPLGAPSSVGLAEELEQREPEAARW